MMPYLTVKYQYIASLLEKCTFKNAKFNNRTIFTMTRMVDAHLLRLLLRFKLSLQVPFFTNAHFLHQGLKLQQISQPLLFMVKQIYLT